MSDVREASGTLGALSTELAQKPCAGVVVALKHRIRLDVVNLHDGCLQGRVTGTDALFSAYD